MEHVAIKICDIKMLTNAGRAWYDHTRVTFQICMQLLVNGKTFTSYLGHLIADHPAFTPHPHAVGENTASIS